MLFGSIDYAIFLVLVFIVYWFFLKKNTKAQNIFLLIVSYIFYGWWDWRFLFLLVLSTCIDYFFGLIVYKAKKRKKLYLTLSILNNLLVLGFFKYYNFFIDSLHAAFLKIGFDFNPPLLQILLPVGISFYTFHGMSYVFDIYRDKTVPTKKFVDYSVFVCFFPLLVAGPIERATHLLPQVKKRRKFNYENAKAGLKQILWGLFKKIVIADTCAIYVNEVFSNYHILPSSILIIGAIYFAFQIYGDFSGYSDIALGSARLLGFELLINFKYPYFSRDVPEFWRRWHISLSSWFRDYLYIPLGGSKGGTFQKIRNVFMIFVVSGFWHGANWTFIVWGALHAIYYLPSMLFHTNRKHLNNLKLIPSFSDIIRILITFTLTTFAWIFFRSLTVSDAFSYIGDIFSFKSGSIPVNYFGIIPFIILMLLVDWFGKDYDFPLREIKGPKILRFTLYFILFYCILAYITTSASSFIYFQF